MPSFNSTREFRQMATKEDYEALKSAYFGHKSSEWGNLSDTYGFSRSSALNLLREANLIDERKPRPIKQEIPLPLRSGSLKTKLRPTHISDDTWNKLQKLYSKYGHLNEKYVLDAILNEAIEKYL